MENARNVELLILDFAGVCSPSAAQLIASGESPTPEIVVDDACVNLVQRVQHRGVIVAILSNEISPDWSTSVPLLSTVDHVVACSDNNIYKPDRRAFQRCLLLTGSAAERTLVVDDEADNITVAASLGMLTVLFNPSDAEESWIRVGEALG